MLLAASLVRPILSLIGILAILLWVAWRMLKRSTDAKDLLMRWFITAGLLVGAWFAIDGVAGDGNAFGQIAGVFMGMLFGLFLAIIWVPPLVDKVSGWFGSLYTGGNEPPKPEPFYSTAQTKRKQGKFREAIYDIQEQLQLFPDDVTGHVMIAEIQAQELKDLPAAQVTIERFCQLPGRPPAHVAYALNALADWHVQINKDPVAAKQALEKIQELLPDTDQGMMAAQRIAHLASAETLLAAREHKPVHLQAGARDVGLMRDSSGLPTANEDAEETAEKLVKQLESFPLDCEAREKLAVIYSEHFGRLDLAAEQLEQLIAAPHQPPKDIARWLNLLADFQINHGADYDTARQTLQRIIDLFPGLAAEQLAQQRIEHLRLELKGKEKGQVVKLGSYEKDLGLKGRRVS